MTKTSGARDYATSFAAQIVVVAAGLVLFRLVASALGTEGFTAYQLGRGLLALSTPVLTLGLAVGLPRYVARDLAVAGGSAASYFWSAVTCVAIPLAFAVIAMNLRPDVVGFLVFGDEKYADLAFPLSVAVIGNTVHGLTYAYLRGLLKIGAANVLQALDLALLPLLIFIVMRSIEDVFLFSGIALTLSCTVSLLYARAPLRTSGSLAHAREILNYGVRRMVGDIVFMAFLVMPQTLAAHFVGFEQAGLIGFSVSTLTLIMSLFAPISIVLLPQASQHAARGEMAAMRRTFALVFVVAISIGIALALSMVVTSPLVVPAYLGTGFRGAVPFVQLIMLAVVPYVAVAVGRSAIDALHVRAINTRNAAISVTISLVLGLIAGSRYHSGIGIIGAFVAGLWIMGLLTVRRLRKDEILVLRGADRIRFGEVLPVAGRMLRAMIPGAAKRATDPALVAELDDVPIEELRSDTLDGDR